MSDEGSPQSIAADVTIAVTDAGAMPPSCQVTLSDLSLDRAVLSNRWEILGMLGMGGMGTVYRARDRELDEVVALKLLRAEQVGLDGIERFRREVKLARRVTHKNVARVHELGEHEGRRFFTMEWVEGESLHQHIDRKGALSIDRALEIAVAIARGLEAAHAVGVIHRDLKPDNVLLGSDGRVAVTDFGIASLTTEPSATQTTSFLGTPLYMAPEQVDRSRPLDARTDLYAFGAVLYEMVTGEVPFQGETPLAIAVARLQRPAPDPRSRRSDLPAPLAQLILACMARAPEDRPSSAAELAHRLEALHTAKPAAVSAPQPSAPPPAAPRAAIPTSSFPWSALARSNTPRLALRPIWNGGASEDAYLADGLSDDLIDGLATVRAVQVLARSVVARFAGRSADPRQVGKELGADVVAEGSLRRAPDGKLRLALRLINATDGLQLWSQRLDFEESEILAVSDRATQQIAAALTSTAQRASRKLSDPQAVDLYLRARAAGRELSPAGAAQAVQYFESALSFNPHDPLLLSGRAIALARLGFFEGDRLKEATEAAEQAVRLAPDSSESQLALANARFSENRMGEALAAALRSIALAPSGSEAQHMAGRILAEVGPLELSRRFLESAHALEPSSFVAADSARVMALQGDPAALAQVEPSAAHAPTDIGYHFVRARLALWAGDEVTAKDSVRVLAGYAKDHTLRGSSTVRVLTAVFDITRSFDIEQARRYADAEQRSIRRSLILLQLMIEALCWRQNHAAAELLLERAVAVGLHDWVWLDRCPLLATLREREPVQRAREALVQRAAEVRSVLPRSPGSFGVLT